jgi:hypothetical protein
MEKQNCSNCNCSTDEYSPSPEEVAEAREMIAQMCEHTNLPRAAIIEHVTDLLGAGMFAKPPEPSLSDRIVKKVLNIWRQS